MRWPTVASVFLIFLLAVPASVGAQADTDDESFSRLEQLVGTLPEEAQFEIRATGLPVSWSDQLGDHEHPSGDDPGYVPDYIDIDSVVAVRLGPGWESLFASTDDVTGPWSLGQGFVDAGDGVLQTYAGESTVRDGSQYRLGAYFFGMRIAGNAPASVPGRCEFVIWIHDIRNPAAWEPELALDPASGTNLAFGIGLNPDGESGTFALELSEASGVFEPSFEFDVRGLFADDFVGVFVPGFAAAEFDAFNASTFCSETGFQFEPGASGADQLGLVDLTPQNLGEYEAAVPPVSATTAPPPNSTPDAPTTSDAVVDDDGGVPWGLALVGPAAVVLVLLAVARRKRP